MQFQLSLLVGTDNEPVEKKFRNLRGWINPPKWADKLEEAQGKRASGTASWILGDAKLQNLQSQVCNTGPSLGKRTLSIQGKVILKFQTHFSNGSLKQNQGLARPFSSQR